MMSDTTTNFPFYEKHGALIIHNKSTYENWINVIKNLDIDSRFTKKTYEQIQSDINNDVGYTTNNLNKIINIIENLTKNNNNKNKNTIIPPHNVYLSYIQTFNDLKMMPDDASFDINIYKKKYNDLYMVFGDNDE